MDDFIILFGAIVVFCIGFLIGGVLDLQEIE